MSALLLLLLQRVRKLHGNYYFENHGTLENGRLDKYNSLSILPNVWETCVLFIYNLNIIKWNIDYVVFLLWIINRILGMIIKR